MKRVICAILSVIMLVSVLSIGAVNVSASSLVTSDAAIEILKQFEGFRAEKYADNGQYSIGYGTTWNEEKYPDGVITEAEAEEELRLALDKCEAATNSIANKHGLSFTQGQFDALVLFAYNLGYGWYVGQENTRLYQAIANGATGNDFIFAMTMWCKASGSIHAGLVSRRLAEANMYLNGAYSKNPPASYSYVIFNGNGGDVSASIQGYDSSSPVAVKATATYSGYYFAGWYTAAEGGQKVTTLDGTTKGKTLYAHWQKNEPIATGKVTASSLFVRATAGSTGAVVDGLAKGSTVEIYEIVTVGTTKWGRIDSGWISLTYVALDGAESEEETPGTGTEPETPEVPDTVIATGTVTASGALTIRKGPGTGYGKAGYYSKGEKVEILEKTTIGNSTWGRTDKGWISLTYVKLDETEPETPDTETPGTGTETPGTGTETPGTGTETPGTGTETPGTGTETPGTGTETPGTGTETPGTGTETPGTGTETPGTGTETPGTGTETPDTGTETPKVITTGTVTGTVYLRKAPGSKGQIIGSIPYGDNVKIYGLQVMDGIVWGQTDGGWISLNYVKLNAALSATVSGGLFIRTGAGTSFKKAGSYAAGAKVMVYETETVNGSPWGRTDKGWINLKYVTFDGLSSGTITPETPETDKPETPETPETPDKPDTTIATGTVTASGALTIRRGPGTGYGVAGYYSKGTKITILEMALSGSTTWGRTDKGWVSLTFVKLDSTPTEPSVPDATEPEGTEPEGTEPGGNQPEVPVTPPASSTIATGTITASSLSVRNGAGAKAKIKGTVSYGTSVTITDLQVADGILWAKTEHGWLSTNYVKLNAPLAAEVTAGGLNIRNKAGLNGTSVGMYVAGDKLNIYETKTISGSPWGRTDRGWINLKYVKFGISSGSTGTPGTGTPGTETPGTPGSSTVITTGTITASALSIRTAGSSKAAIIGSVYMGEVVKIYDLQVSDGVLWGHTDKGWISMNYVKLGTPLTGKVTASTLNVRNKAGFGGTAVDFYSSGDNVVIYETATSNGLAWGLTSKGWISLNYVEMNG